MADNFFSIDLGETTFRIADLRRNGNLFEAVTMGMQDVDPVFFRTDSDKIIEKTASDLDKTIKQLKIKKKLANVTIPDGHSFNQFIEMPQLNEKELLSALKYQADQFIPMPLEEVNLDVEIVHENRKDRKILTLVAASPKKVIERVEKLLDYIGIVPLLVEPEVSTVGRLATEMFKKGVSARGVLLINVGYSSTSIYFFDQTWGLLTFSHNFPIGYNVFLKEIQVNLNVDLTKSTALLKNFGAAENASYRLDSVLSAAVKDFIAEIERSMKELKNQNKPQVTNVYLFNDVLRFNSLEKIIGSYFGLPTTVLDMQPLFTKNNIVDYFKNDLAYFTSCVGEYLR